jgi:DNA-binding PucR family transcriptional regulator
VGAPQPVQGRPDGPDARAQILVAATARSLPGIQSLCEQMGDRLLEEWPAFGADPDLAGELRRAIYANLDHVFSQVMPSGSSESLVAPAEALDFATSVLHRGIDTSDLIQAYRVGQNMAWSWWMEQLAAQVEDRALLVEAIDLSSERVFAYVDAVVEAQVRLWEDERRHWAGRPVAERGQAVRQVLSQESLTQAQATRALGFATDREMVAAILWERERVTSEDSVMARLEQAAEAIGRTVGARASLMVPSGALSLWIWLSGEEPFDLDVLARVAESRLGEGQRVALGLADRGTSGFKASHRQALRARRVAELSSSPSAVTRFDEVETLCLISEDPDLLDSFVRRQLGPLAEVDRTAQRMRETAQVWLQEGGNARRTADRLHTHRNTILYRVHRAEKILGRSLSEDRLGLELALTVVERIGLPPFSR